MTPERPDTTPIAVWLELDLDARPVKETLSRPDDVSSPFVGWLGLTAGLHGLHGEPDPLRRENPR